jgi:hypothetical protein
VRKTLAFLPLERKLNLSFHSGMKIILGELVFPFRLISVHLMCSGNIPSKIKVFIG